ncbi:Aste57867_4643 [Aphanomyces stellatus]|uniref:Aste57867_4643 protein n=1 Tax=Aphanomyces stellatus TaxID=120398 RepID=A0A485KC29_9STRA|nr:hypothetical protein As57867_004630 [Aphanomyces stellatus]VFT81746.1 Aste57867_4643 [Aphanomyces stellatus]
MAFALHSRQPSIRRQRDSPALNGIVSTSPAIFCRDCFSTEDTIPSISGHVDTGEPLLQVLLDKLAAANHFMSATNFLGQLHTSVMDMALHHDFDPSSTDESIFDLNQRLAPRYRVIPLLPEDRTLCRNYHIFPGEIYFDLTIA